MVDYKDFHDRVDAGRKQSTSTFGPLVALAVVLLILAGIFMIASGGGSPTAVPGLDNPVVTPPAATDVQPNSQ